MVTEKQYQSDALDWEEGQALIRSLIESGRKKKALFIATGIYTGLRWSDIRRFTYGDLLLEKFIIQEIKTKNTSKKKKRREITLSDNFNKIVHECLEKDFDEKAFAFTNKNGKVLSSQYMNQELKKLKSEFNISAEKFSIHSLRKCFGRKIWESYNKSSEGLIMLQQIFNHSSPETTLIYLGIRRQEISACYKSL